MSWTRHQIEYGGWKPDARFVEEVAYTEAIAQRDALRESLTDMVGWFNNIHGAFTNKEMLRSGCPNDLRASLERARAALDGAK